MAVGRCLVLLLLQLGCFKCRSANSTQHGEGGNFDVTILMPHVVAYMADNLVCAARQLGPEEAYIVKFTPHASKRVIHHLMVYGCPQAASNQSSWMCDHFESNEFSNESVCAGGERQILFAWALDAPEMALPEGVGIRVSGSTGINYLVVQLHYAHAFPPGVTDNSGITLELTYNRPPQQVGYLVLGNWGKIPPQAPDYRMDSVCDYPLNYTIYPIGFRTHAHNLGVVTSGYRIRQGKWLKIGKMSPQRPQAFYKVSQPGMDVRKGDVLAARCVMDSRARTTVTKIGLTNHDEMCNFFILYSTFEKSNLKSTYCFKHTDKYTWLDTFKPEEIPQDSRTLDGIPGALGIMDKFDSLAIAM
ncbi:hypothetical protein BsWGS_01767 [Bradybaena similaris]